MGNLKPFRSWLLLVMGTLVLLAACFARLEEMGKPVQTNQAPAVAIAPTALETQAPPVTVSPTVSFTAAITPTATFTMVGTIVPPPPTRKVGKRVNLANGTPVPANELIDIPVRRADGTYDSYLVPPWLNIGTGSEVDARLNQLMEIKPGDQSLGFINYAKELEIQGVPSPTPLPTLPLRKRVNLMVTPEPELIIMNVHRADGAYDEYWVPGSVFRATTAEIYAKLNQLLEIQPGDEFFGWHSRDFSQVKDTPAAIATAAP